MSNNNAYDSAIGAIGNTPLVYLQHVTQGLNARIAVKLEYLNPAGSVKDRTALFLIQDAEKRGVITPGKTVLVEGTSGNTGIALAFLARLKGYKLIIVMPAHMSLERRALLKAYGAEVILSDPALGFKGVEDRAKAIVAAVPHAHMLDQFSNPANVEAHYRTTGPEIWRQTEGKVDLVCFGVGTGGTVTGVTKYLKEQKPEIESYAVEPDEAAVLSGEKPGKHRIMGIGSSVIPPILDQKAYKGIIRVHSDAAIAMARRLALEEAILAGISSGANVCAAIQLSQRPEHAGKLIVTTINSNGERYLSTELYANAQEAATKMAVGSDEEAIATAKKFVGIAANGK